MRRFVAVAVVLLAAAAPGVAEAACTRSATGPQVAVALVSSGDGPEGTLVVCDRRLGRRSVLLRTGRGRGVAGQGASGTRVWWIEVVRRRGLEPTLVRLDLRRGSESGPRSGGRTTSAASSASARRAT